MLKVEDMSPAEMHALLQRESFGHLGCARDGRPYVVPMHYAYDGKDLYFFTTEGMKTRFIQANPQVCLQVEEVTDAANRLIHSLTIHAPPRNREEEARKAHERALKRFA